MRRQLASLALLFALLPAAAVAQRAGVLLGFDDGSTLWVARDSLGRVRTLRSDTLLIVPRRDGFWKAGVSSTASVRSDGTGRRRRAARRPECVETEYRPNWFELSVWAGPLDRRPFIKRLSGSEAADLREECGTRDIALTFVSPDYVSIDEHFTTEYVAGLNIRQRGAIVPIDSLARRGYAALLDLEQALVDPIPTDSATDARLVNECRTNDEAARIDKLLEGESGYERFIRRAPGRWQLVLRFSRPGAAWQGMVVECRTDYQLPSSVVGYDALPARWEAIEEQVRGARDAVGSPAGDMLVVLAGGKLLVFAPRGGQLGTPIAESPAPPGDLVLAQWATGTHVSRWSAQLAPYLAPVIPARGTR